MKPQQRKRLTAILAIQAETGRTKTMRKHIRTALEDAGCTVRQIDRQLYARKGDSNDPVPVIVAHADTVHRIVEPNRYRVESYLNSDGELVYGAYDPTTNKARGVGGDDKCGLFIAVEAARRLKDVGVLITVDEETGAQGARRVPPLELAHAAVLIQADRRGNSDAIMEASGVTLSSKGWRDHVTPVIEAHGYEWSDYGALTDVSELVAEQIAHVSAINVSAGYHNAHTTYETVKESELENALELVIDLARASTGKRWPHTAERQRYGYATDWFTEWKGRASRRVGNYNHPRTTYKTGDLWHVGNATFRLDRDGVWRSTTSAAPTPLRDLDAELADLPREDDYRIIPCDVASCTEEAEDWHKVARLTLCARHLADADQAVAAGYDLDDLAYVLAD